MKWTHQLVLNVYGYKDLLKVTLVFFWASLNGLDDESIGKSQEIGKFSYDNEKKLVS